MSFIWQAQSLIFLLLSIAALVLSLVALIHAAVTKPDVFVRADKRTKLFWLAITGGSALLSFLSIPGGAGRGSLLLMILPLVGAGIYLTDVRPALKEYGKRPQGGSDGWRSW